MMLAGLGLAVTRAWRAGSLVNPVVVMWGMPLLLLGLPSLSADEKLQADTAFNLVITVAILGTCAATWIAYHIRAFRTPDNIFARDEHARVPDVGWLRVGALAYLAFMGGTIGA